MFFYLYIIGVYKKKQHHHLPTIRHIQDNLSMEWGKEHTPSWKANWNNRRMSNYTTWKSTWWYILYMYVLRTGCQWKMLPKEYGSGSTTYHRRFQEWVGKRVFEKLWIRLLEIYDDIRGIEWEWQSLDCVSVKAPLERSDRS